MDAITVIVIVLVVGTWWLVYKFIGLFIQSTVELIPPALTLGYWFLAPKKTAKKMAVRKAAEWVAEAKEFEDSVREELGSMAEKGGKWASILKSEAAQQYEAAMKKAREKVEKVKDKANAS